MTITEASDTILAFERELDGERIACTFNLSAEPQPVTLPGGEPLHLLGEAETGRLGPYAAHIALLP